MCCCYKPVFLCAFLTLSSCDPLLFPQNSTGVSGAGFLEHTPACCFRRAGTSNPDVNLGAQIHAPS